MWDLLRRLAVPEEFTVLFAAMSWACSIDEGARADFCLSADQVGHEAKDLVGEIAVTENIALAKTRSED